MPATGIAHTAELQKLRRPDCPGGKNDLRPCAHPEILSVAAVTDGARPLAVETDAADMRTGDHRQIAPPHRRAQKGLGAGTSPSVTGRCQIGRDARPLEGRLVTDGQLALAADFEKIGRHRVKMRAVVGDRQMRRSRIIPARRFKVVEVRQDILVGPAVIACRRPVVIIARLAAMVDKRVDGPGSAEHLAARMINHPPVEAGHGIRAEHPVHRFLVEQDAIANRDLDPEPAVGRPGLEKQHPVLPASRQLLGHAAGRTATDDDVVEFPHRTLPISSGLLFKRAGHSRCSLFAAYRREGGVQFRKNEVRRLDPDRQAEITFGDAQRRALFGRARCDDEAGCESVADIAEC